MNARRAPRVVRGNPTAMYNKMKCLECGSTEYVILDDGVRCAKCSGLIYSAVIVDELRAAVEREREEERYTSELNFVS